MFMPAYSYLPLASASDGSGKRSTANFTSLKSDKTHPKARDPLKIFINSQSSALSYNFQRFDFSMLSMIGR